MPKADDDAQATMNSGATMRDGLRCKIYLDCEDPRQDVVAKLVRVVHGVADRSTIISPLLAIDVREKGEHRYVKKRLDKDFLLYRYYLEIKPSNAVENDKYQAAVGRLLGALWRSGWQAVGSCDFERELPRRPLTRLRRPDNG